MRVSQAANVYQHTHALDGRVCSGSGTLPSSAMASSQVPTTITPAVTRLLQYLDAHLLDPSLSVKTVRNACGTNDHNISSVFAVQVGLTMREYIDKGRMAAAVTMLASPAETSMVEVAYALGYEHVQTFYRVFRRTFGCTPAGYRAIRLGLVE
jgi:AraC-like DNA-binding protein